MRRSRIAALAVALATLGVAAVARADLAPPEDYVESCTVERQQAEGETCVSCRVTYADFEACRNTYEPQGYAYRCKSWGASAYDEVLCKGGAAAGSGGTGGGSSFAPGGQSTATATATTTSASGGQGTGGQSTATATSASGGQGTGTGTSADARTASGDGGCAVAPHRTGAAGLLLSLALLGLVARRRR